MTTQTSTPTFYPGLLYRDADSGMKWLEDVLGCERREDHRDDEGTTETAWRISKRVSQPRASTGEDIAPPQARPAA